MLEKSRVDDLFRRYSKIRVVPPPPPPHGATREDGEIDMQIDSDGGDDDTVERSVTRRQRS